MKALKNTLTAVFILCICIAVSGLFLQYPATIMIPPLAMGGIAQIALGVSLAAFTAGSIISLRSDREKPKARRVLRIITTVIADIVLVFAIMIGGWLYGGSTVDKVVKSPDGKHDTVLIIDSTFLGQPVYKYYVHRSGLIYDHVRSASEEDPEIVWTDDGVTIERQYYGF